MIQVYLASVILLLCSVHTETVKRGAEQRTEQNDFENLKAGVVFEFYSMGHKFGKDVVVSSVPKLDEVPFDHSRPTRILVHGFRGEEYTRIMVAAYRDGNFKINLIAINWLKFGAMLNKSCVHMYQHYKKCVEKVPALGRYVATFIDGMKIPPSKITVIAHSLGVYVSSNAAKGLPETGEKFAKIWALDPAGPEFRKKKSSDILNKRDATYVEIMHTSTSWLGSGRIMGHSSYFVNGGQIVVDKFIGDMTTETAHTLAYVYAAETVRNPKAFPAHRCTSAGNAKRGIIDKGSNAPEYFMGGEPGNTEPEGEFFFVFQKEEQYVDSDLAYGEYVAPAGYEADDENDGLIY